jgi:cyanate lyase
LRLFLAHALQLMPCATPVPDTAAGRPGIQTFDNSTAIEGCKTMMKTEEMVEAIIEAKYAKGTNWQEISKAAGMSEIFVVSACLGQNTLPAEAAGKVVKFLDLGNRAKDVEIALQRPPKKAQAAETVSKDPLIYRFHEITYVYGDSIKEMIHEKFGDGIMSAIDFDLHVDRIPDPKGDRVQVTMSGKFLPYKQW